MREPALRHGTPPGQSHSQKAEQLAPPDCQFNTSLLARGTGSHDDISHFRSPSQIAHRSACPELTSLESTSPRRRLSLRKKLSPCGNLAGRPGWGGTRQRGPLPSLGAVAPPFPKQAPLPNMPVASRLRVHRLSTTSPMSGTPLRRRERRAMPSPRTSYHGNPFGPGFSDGPRPQRRGPMPQRTRPSFARPVRSCHCPASLRLLFTSAKPPNDSNAKLHGSGTSEATRNPVRLSW